MYNSQFVYYMCVCLSVTTLAATAINHCPKERFHRPLYNVLDFDS